MVHLTEGAMIRQHVSTFLAGLLSGLLAAGVVLLFIARPKRFPIQLLPPPTPAPLRIHISGAVQNPGVYRIPPGSIYENALQAAGGRMPEADLARINLAAPLEDGQHLYIPFHLENSSTPFPDSTGLLNNPELLDVNLATAAELEQLPGIGPSLAKGIIAFREEHGLFLAPDDLLNVSGIGPSKLEQIRDLITCQ